MAEDANVGASDFTLAEGFAIGITKVATERMLKPFVGDATLMSATAKGILAVVASAVIPNQKLMGVNMRRTVANALLIDAVEDAATVAFQIAMPMLGVGGARVASMQDVATFF